VMAGLMLAAQTINEAMGHEPLGGLTARAVMQFMDPTASTNNPVLYARDPSCAMCRPESPAAAVWRRRYEEF
jgi:hypothetical protein